MIPGVRLVNFDVVPLGKGTASKPVVKLQSGRRSQMQFVNSAMVTMSPAPEGVVTTFADTSVDGQVLNLCGIVQEVSQVEYTKALKAPVKSFKQLDQNVIEIPMKQHGAGVWKDGVKDSAEVIVWGAIAKEGIRTMFGRSEELAPSGSTARTFSCWWRRTFGHGASTRWKS